MNRFEFTTSVLADGEVVVTKHENVKIYDGHEKVGKQHLRILFCFDSVWILSGFFNYRKHKISHKYFRLHLKMGKLC